MPHMHLPLQSGSDSVLRRMARRCKTSEFASLVQQARSSVAGFNVTTDIIVGFPGESEEHWRETMNFVETTGFGATVLWEGRSADTQSSQVFGYTENYTRVCTDSKNAPEAGGIAECKLVEVESQGRFAIVEMI